MIPFFSHRKKREESREPTNFYLKQLQNYGYEKSYGKESSGGS